MTKHIKTEIKALQAVQPRKLFYIPSSDRDMANMPREVQDEFATGLSVARLGGHPPSAKPWKGEGSGIYELIQDFQGDTYRAVYSVKHKEVVYLLHAFKKKSKSGIKTPLPDVRKVGSRLKQAESHHAETFKSEKGKRKH